MFVLDGGYVATCDPHGTEHGPGYVAVDDKHIAAVSSGPVPESLAAAERIDVRDHLVTPGLVNTHHHLYQWLTRGYATDATLFEWLTTLYPIWSRLDEELVHAASSEPRLARRYRLQHDHRSSLRLPGRRRRPAGSRDPRRPAHRTALPSHPRFDESRPVRRRAAT
jgi:hypothetical protein